MSRPLPSGSLVALITPFRDGAIDWDPFAALIELQIEHGSVALVPCGSTGEAATLSHEEHTQVVRFAVEHARGRVPVIAGTGSNSTAEAIRLTTEAKRAGAAGALLISPYYNRPTQEGIVAHFRAIADAVELPLILYNIPGRTASPSTRTSSA
jgi:4-hydroxy-tetrahydrodipicolinate synthase